MAASVQPGLFKEASTNAARVRPNTPNEERPQTTTGMQSDATDEHASGNSPQSMDISKRTSPVLIHSESFPHDKEEEEASEKVAEEKKEEDMGPPRGPAITSPLHRKFTHFKDAARIVAMANRSISLAERGLRQAKKVVEAAPIVDASTNERAPWARQLRPSSTASSSSSAHDSSGKASTTEETSTPADATNNLEAVLAAHPLADAHWWGYTFEEKLLVKPASLITTMPNAELLAHPRSPSKKSEVFEVGVEAAMAAAKKLLPPFPGLALWIQSEGLAKEQGDERLHEAASDVHAQDPFTCIALTEARCFRDAVSVLIFLKHGGNLHDLPLVDQRFLLTKPLRYVTSWSSKLLHQPLPTLLGAFIVQAEVFRRPPRALFELQAFKSFAVPSVAVVVPLPSFEALCAKPSGMDADVRSVAVADPFVPRGLKLPVDKAMACGLGLVLPQALCATADKYANHVQGMQRAREAIENPAKDRAIAEAAARERELKQMRHEDGHSLAAARLTQQRTEEEAAGLALEAAKAEAAEKAFSPDK